MFESGAYCIDPESIYFDGIEDGKGNTDVPNLVIGPCKGPRCYSELETKRRMADIKKFSLGIRLNDSNVDFKDFDEPLKRGYKFHS